MKTWTPGLAVASVLAGVCLLAMLVATVTWMTVPIQIVYQQSSPVQTEQYSVEVVEHGNSYFLTPVQKENLDFVRRQTPIVWFACAGYLFFYWAFGGFEALRRLH
jgi:hypothetical protein